jgi:hypothetical protein
MSQTVDKSLLLNKLELLKTDSPNARCHTTLIEQKKEKTLCMTWLI